MWTVQGRNILVIIVAEAEEVADLVVDLDPEGNFEYDVGSLWFTIWA